MPLAPQDWKQQGAVNPAARAQGRPLGWPAGVARWCTRAARGRLWPEDAPFAVFPGEAPQSRACVNLRAGQAGGIAPQRWVMVEGSAAPWGEAFIRTPA